VSVRPLISVVNRLGAVARAAGLGRGDLDPDGLLAEAGRVAGEAPAPGGAWRAGFERLVASLDGEARLSTLGRYHSRQLVLGALVTRLRLDAARAGGDLPALRHPPLIVCGPPRSGTTFLHRLLAAVRPEAAALPFWQLVEPLPGPGPDRRPEEARTRLRRLAWLAPELDAQHPIRPDLPDECGHLLKPAFLSAHYWQAPVYGFVDHLLEADGAEAYRDYADLLACLAPDGPLILKDPFHARHLEALLAVLPDAVVVCTWRDPVEVVPSFHKLVTTMQRVLSDQVDVERSVEQGTRLLVDTARRAAGAERVIPVDYTALVADPAAVVRRVHERIGIAPDAATDARVARFVADNPQRRYGDNPYRPEDFGQTARAIRDRFEAAGVPCP
jgi:hypothetical protein